MKILFAVSEAEPFVKTGGLADVAGHLPPALAEHGHCVSLFLPHYQAIADSRLEKCLEFTIPLGRERSQTAVVCQRRLQPGLTAYFIAGGDFFDRPHLYGPPGDEYPDNGRRFIFFCRAVLESVRRLGLEPDIYHTHDWQTALIPVYLKTLYRDLTFKQGTSLFTIHNLGYQGLQDKMLLPETGLGWEEFTWQKLEYFDRLNLLKGGLVYADALSTVSPSYSREILEPEFGFGLDGVLRERQGVLTGILNGVDYTIWDPAVDPHISHRYRIGRMGGKKHCKRKLLQELELPSNPDLPLVGMVSRMVGQKGFDLILKLLERAPEFNCRFIFLGSGESKIEEQLQRLSCSFSETVACHCGYDNRLAHQIEAGADIFLMPSYYEPCGLNQLYSLRYGTVPVVRAVGGLNDSIEECSPAEGLGNGFKFQPYTTAALQQCLERALTLYRQHPRFWWQLRRRGMECDFSWHKSAAEYEKLYTTIQK
jgi:starch synthase